MEFLFIKVSIYMENVNTYNYWYNGLKFSTSIDNIWS
jgi:hypothetical protein